MISWLIGIKQGISFQFGKNYKFMEAICPRGIVGTTYVHL